MWWWKRSRWSETVKGFGLLAETTSWVNCHFFFGYGRAAKEDGEGGASLCLCSCLYVVGRKERKVFGGGQKTVTGILILRKATN
jgi:hypothetical protein